MKVLRVVGPIVEAFSRATLVATLIFVSLSGRASAQSAETQSPPTQPGQTQPIQAQSTDDILQRLQAIKAENALLAKENKELRERIKLGDENAKLQGRVSDLASAPAPRKQSKSVLYDSASKSPPPPFEPAYSWTGFYIGGNAGFAWGADPTVSFSPKDVLSAGIGGGPPIPLGGTSSTGGPPSSAVGGFQLGYNWQFNQAELLGIETDLNLSNFRTSGAATYFPFLLPFQSTANEQVKWFGTVRARLGYLPTNNLLIYGTGGLAFGRIDQNTTLSNISGGPVGYPFAQCPAFTTCYSGTSNTIGVGWTAGAGLEYALWSNLTVKAEYLYVDLGGHTFNENGLGLAAPSSYVVRVSDTDFAVVRGGINYKF